MSDTTFYILVGGVFLAASLALAFMLGCSKLNKQCEEWEENFWMKRGK